jgi:DNA repair protein RadD
MIDLRYYQQEAVNAVYAHLQQKPDSNPCAVLPTGAGKSIVIARIVTDAATLWGGRVLILAHVKELLEQNAAKIAALCPDLKIGMYSAGLNRRDTENQVLVAGIQSVYNKADELGKFDLILIDEAHLIPPDGDGMYQTLLQEEKKLNGNVRLIGFTATPYRLRGGLICKKGNLLNEICYEIGVRELIMRGYLSKLRSKNGKTKAELENLHIRGGEFIADEVAAKMDNERLVTAAVSELIQQTADRKKVLIFASSVLHAKHIKTRIEEASGQECGIVVGNTSREDRAEILARFQDKKVPTDLFGNSKPNLKFLVNVGVLTTGFDAPAVDTVVLLRPTASPGLYYQMVGRGFRLSPDTGKTDCMILDYGQNIMRHGPVDMIRVDEADPDGRKKKPVMRECPQCQAVFPAGRTTCPDCGYEMPREEGKLHHGASAASDGILSGESSETEFEVKRVYYSKHFKRNAPEKPPTLKVEYAIGFNDYISDWICPEHTGYARKKSEKWWKERAGFDLPDTVDECLIYADAQKLKEPVRVKVRKLPGSQWPTITAYEFDPEQPEPDGEPTITESQAMVLASQRIAEIRKEAEAAGPWTDLDFDREEREAIKEWASQPVQPINDDDLEDADDMPF